MEERKKDALFLLLEIVAHLDALIDNATFLKARLESNARRLREEAERNNE